VEVFLTILPDRVIVQARAEGPGGMLGDLMQEVHAGQSFLVWTYEELRVLGAGRREITSKP
jgi:hypothetical protein